MGAKGKIWGFFYSQDHGALLTSIYQLWKKCKTADFRHFIVFSRDPIQSVCFYAFAYFLRLPEEKLMHIARRCCVIIIRVLCTEIHMQRVLQNADHCTDWCRFIGMPSGRSHCGSFTVSVSCQRDWHAFAVPPIGLRVVKTTSHTGKVQLLVVKHGLLFYSCWRGTFEILRCFSGKSDPPVGHLLGYNPLGILCDRLDRTSNYEMDRIKGGQSRCLKL